MRRRIHFFGDFNFEPEVLAAKLLMTSAPSYDDLRLYDKLIKDLKTAASLTHGISNLGTAFRALWFTGHNKQSTLINWPASIVSQLTEIGTLGFTSNYGLDSNGSTACADLTFKTGNDGSSVHGAIVTVAGTGNLVGGRSDILQNAGSYLGLTATNGVGQAASRSSSASESASGAHGGAVGMHAILQASNTGDLSGNRSSYWKNGVWVSSASSPASSGGGSNVPNTVFLASRTTGSPAPGGHFTGKVGAGFIFYKAIVNQPLMYAAFQTYFSAKGVTI